MSESWCDHILEAHSCIQWKVEDCFPALSSWIHWSGAQLLSSQPHERKTFLNFIFFPAVCKKYRSFPVAHVTYIDRMDRNHTWKVMSMYNSKTARLKIYLHCNSVQIQIVAVAWTCKCRLSGPGRAVILKVGGIGTPLGVVKSWMLPSWNRALGTAILEWGIGAANSDFLKNKGAILMSTQT